MLYIPLIFWGLVGIGGVIGLIIMIKRWRDE
jgi:hypothetical protein